MIASRILTAALCAILLPAVSHARPRGRTSTGHSVRLSATAYCRGGKTQSGVTTRRGTIAADPRVLPVGTMVRIEGLGRQYSGTYRVTDTGGSIKGRKVDIFMPSCAEARKFGRRRVVASVLRQASGR